MAIDPRLLGPRVESCWVELLDEREVRIGTLDGPKPGDPHPASGVIDGSVTWNVDTEIMGGASLNIANPDIDWMRTRFRPWVLVNDLKWPLGTFLPAAPERSYDGRDVRVSPTLLDKTSILSGTQVVQTYSVGISSPVTSVVQGILTTVFGFPAEQVAISPSPKTLLAMMTWQPGTSWLKIVNELLATIAFNRLWCDRQGRFRAEAWTDPKSVVPSMEFVEGESAIHSPKFSVSQDIASVPNRVTCVTTGDDTHPALIATATNTDPLSPYSYTARGGRWVDAFYDAVDATDQATLQTIAHKNLANLSTPPWTLSVSHAVVPLQGRDVVRFTSADVDRVAWVNEWGITLKPGSLMTGKWLGVTS